MPPMLHDPAVRDSIKSRVQKLTPDARRAWGTMTVDQMLWHCNLTMEAALGRTHHTDQRIPLPGPVIRFLVLNTPWIKGAPTHPDWVAGQRWDFHTEQARCLRLIDDFGRTPLEGGWARSPTLGKMSGRDWSRLQAKHLDHHLKQFSA